MSDKISIADLGASYDVDLENLSTKDIGLVYKEDGNDLHIEQVANDGVNIAKVDEDSSVDVGRLVDDNLEMRSNQTTPIEVDVLQGENIEMIHRGTLIYHPTSEYLQTVRAFYENPNTVTAIYEGAQSLADKYDSKGGGLADARAFYENANAVTAIYEGSSTLADKYALITDLNALAAIVDGIESSGGGYAGWDLLTGGVLRETITNGFDLDFIGDTTYIQVQYNGTNNRLEFSYVGPTSFYEGWDIWVDGVDTGSRVTSAMDVNLISGTYTQITHNFLTGPPPHNDITVDIDTAALDGRYYTQSAMGTILADYALQSWVNGNFDNYGSWNLQTGGVTREAIVSGFNLDFIGDTTYIQVQYNATEGRLEFSYVGPTDFYAGWDIWIDSVDTGSRVTSGMDVNFIPGTYVNLTHNFLTGPPPHNDITIEVDTNALNGVFMDRTELGTTYYSQTYINNNFDNYGGWDLWTGVLRETIGPGDKLDFIGGTDMQVQYDAVNNTLTFDYVGSPGTMDNWNLLVDGAGPYSIANAAKVDLIAGTGVTLGYNFNSGTATNEVTITATPDLSAYYTKTEADALFYSQTYINNNFDNYGGWDLYTGGVLRETIGSGVKVDFIGGTDMQVQYDAVNNTLTFDYVGSASYTNWNLLVDGAGPYGINNLEKVDFIAGSGVSLGYNFNSGTATNEVTISATVSSPWLAGTGGIYYSSGNVGIGIDSPRQLLDVAGAGSLIQFDANGGLKGTTGSPNTLVVYGNSNGRMDFDTTYATSSLGGFEFATGGTTRMLIRGDGNVGVGTSTPGTKFEVADVVGTTVRIKSTKDGVWAAGDLLGGLEFYGSDLSAVGAGVKAYMRAVSGNTYGAAFGLDFGTCPGGSAVESRMTIDKDGNIEVKSGLIQVSKGSSNVYVGDGVRTAGRAEIGLHAPSAASISEIQFGYGDNSSDTTRRWAISDRGTTDGRLIIYSAPAISTTWKDLVAFSDGAMQLNGTLSTTGTVSVPTSKRFTTGSVSFWEEGTSSLLRNYNPGGLVYLQAYNSSSVSKTMFRGDPDGSATLYYQGSEKLGTRSTGVYVTGDLIASGEVESYDTSDIRLKDKIADLDEDQVAANTLGYRTIRYWHKLKKKWEVGLIAQDVQKTRPENVKEDGNGNLMIHYGKMIPDLLTVDKVQARQIQVLKNENIAKDKKIRSLEKRLEKLEKLAEKWL